MAKIYDIQPAEPAKRKKRVRVKASDMKEHTLAVGPTAEDEDAVLVRLAARKEPKATFGEEPPVEPKHHIRRRRPSRLYLAVGFLALLAAGVWLAGPFISKAEVDLTGEPNYLPFSFDLTFSKDVSSPTPSKDLYPLTILRNSSTSTREYAATGEGEVKTKARGKIQVFNEYGTGSQILVAQTRFVSPDGKVFRLTKQITVPGGKWVAGKLQPGSIMAEVLADQAGPDYNIAPTRFTIPGFKGTARYAAFYGISSEAFTGGAIGRAKFVTDNDIKQAEADSAKRIFDELKAAVVQSLPETVRLIEGASRIDVKQLTASAKAGDAVDKFTVTTRADITALVFDETHVQEKARALLPKDQAYFTPYLKVTYEPTEAVFSSGRLKVHAEGSVDVARSIDIFGLKRALLAKSENEVRSEILSVPGIKEARVKFWPFWVRRMPSASSRIELVVK